jgi:hypothetical protein
MTTFLICGSHEKTGSGSTLCVLMLMTEGRSSEGVAPRDSGGIEGGSLCGLGVGCTEGRDSKASC